MDLKIIKLIKTDEIWPHPDNPRKDLGDLTELTESIRKNGIFQNMTVVPGHVMSEDEYVKMYVAEGGKKSDAKHAYNRESAFVGDGYTVVIGHRRLAAAKAAGLDEVPCTVADLDEREQLCTMMEENMQRQDLTVLEQAYGFQFMLDLGENIKSIASRTGFGETTIRHRLEIAKLDWKTVEENQTKGNYQLTVNDLIELEKIKDIEKRNQLIQDAYSHADLVSKIDTAVEKEKQDAALEELRPLLEAAGVEPAPKTLYEWQPGVTELSYARIDLNKKLPKHVKTPAELPEGAKLYWRLTSYDSTLRIYQKIKEQKKEETEADRKRKEAKEKIGMLKELHKEKVEDIRNFIARIDEGKIKSQINEAETIQMIWDTAMRSGVEFRPEKIFDVRGTHSWSITKEEAKELVEGFLQRKLSTQMILLLSNELKGYKFETVGYDGEYRTAEGGNLLKVIFMLVTLYGFRPDAELSQIADGTHELYLTEEED